MKEGERLQSLSNRERQKKIRERWGRGKEGVRARKREEGKDRRTDVDRKKSGLLGQFVICKISQALHHHFYTVVYLCGRCVTGWPAAIFM